MARRDTPKAGKGATRPSSSPPSPAAGAAAVGSAAAGIRALEAQLGYSFERPERLQLALTHSSFIYEARLGRAKTNADEPNQPGTDNEQLEFLGDAVLGLATTELLLREFPHRSEGELTRMRASLVSRKRMAALGETLRLGELLLLGKSAEVSEGRQKPAVLANTAEAVLGAIYLDVADAADARARSNERALRVVRGIVERLLVAPDLPGIHAELEATGGRGALRDAKSRLQERIQAVHAGRLFYADIEETGPAHDRRFSVEARLESPGGRIDVLAQADGPSKKEAQQAAAQIALDQLASADGKAAEKPASTPEQISNTPVPSQQAPSPSNPTRTRSRRASRGAAG